MLNAPFRQSQEVGQQLVAGFRQHTFRVELHTLEMGVMPVTQSHHGVVLQPGGDFQAVGKTSAISDQAVISGRREWLGQACEDAFAPMQHR